MAIFDSPTNEAKKREKGIPDVEKVAWMGDYRGGVWGPFSTSTAQIYCPADDHRCPHRGVMPIFRDAQRRKDPVVCDPSSVIEKGGGEGNEGRMDLLILSPIWSFGAPRSSPPCENGVSEGDRRSQERRARQKSSVSIDGTARLP